MSTPSLARSEREELCDLALAVGGSAPTLCGDWNVRELVAHLLVRERNPVAGTGIVVPQLAGLHDRAVARQARGDLATLVGKLRKARSPLTLPGVDQLVNTLEFFVHHEDIRRAQPDWKPRELDDRSLGLLWNAARVSGKGLVRPAGVPVTIKRRDTGATAVLSRGSDPVVVTGPVQEVVMFLYGRKQTVGLEFAGPPEAVAKLKTASLGI